MNDTPRAGLIALYGMLLAAVGAVRRLLEEDGRGGGAAERGSPAAVRAEEGTAGHRAPPAGVAATDPDRLEVVASVEQMRQALFEALFVLDFVVVHRRLDSVMVRRVREAVVGGIDSADACLQEAAAGP